MSERDSDLLKLSPSTKPVGKRDCKYRHGSAEKMAVYRMLNNNDTAVFVSSSCTNELTH